jgi:Golgi phosphoprotein 3 (GPP34)
MIGFAWTSGGIARWSTTVSPARIAGETYGQVEGIAVGVSSRSIRGDALMASVKLGGGGWQTADDLYQLGAGAVVSEAALERVVLVERGRLRPGPVPGEGALERLAREVEAEPKPTKIEQWLRGIAPWAQYAIGEELEAAGQARLVWKRFLKVFLRQPYLEILDQGAQDEVYRVVRETLLGNHATMPEAALLALLAGSRRYHVQMRRRQARLRGRELQVSLPDDVQVVLEVYGKWRSKGPPE